MDPTGLHLRNISNNNFADNATIYQNNIQNLVADQTDQCLKDLRPTDPRDDKSRIQQTNGGLLKGSYYWVIENETFKQWRGYKQNRLLLINGDPGKGKTMLLCGIIDELSPTTKLAKSSDRTAKTFLSYFFCQGADSRINNATAVLRGLIYLIIIQEPSLISHVQKRYNHTGTDLFIGINAWVAVSDILQNILHDPIVEEIILIVDALDECETDLPKLLDFISRQTLLPHVKWGLSSRNILHIQQRLESCIQQGILSLELKANAESVSQAVDTYIEHSISRLYSVQHNQGQREELKDVMKQKANGTFLWVSLVMKELEDVQHWEIMEIVKEMPTELTAVYRRMVSQIQHLRKGNAKFCWSILSAIFTAYYPLSLAELGILSNLPSEISRDTESIAKLVTMCGSFLAVREGTIYFIHQSAKDFLSTETFQFDAAQRHADIYWQSIAAIAKLPRNIYRLSDFGFRRKNALSPSQNLLISMRYCCLFWADHFCDSYGAKPPQSKTEAALDESLLSFLNDCVFRWLESLSLLGRVTDGPRSIEKVLLEFNASPQLSSYLHDIKRFIISNGSIIDRAPLQIYGSALAFSPMSSKLRDRHWKERLPFIKDVRGIAKTNKALLQTLDSHHCIVIAISLSLNGKIVASGGYEGAIRVWDVTTGALQRTFMTDDDNVLAASFSPDCNTIMFVSSKGYKIFDGYRFRIGRITALLDDTAAAAHSDGAVVYGESQVLRGSHDTDSALASFSPDGKTLALMFEYGLVELWNTATGVHLRTLKVITATIAFSPDNKTLAIGNRYGRGLKIWDVAAGVHLKAISPAPYEPTAMAFHPGSEKPTLGYIYGGCVRMMDIGTGTCHGTMLHHHDGYAPTKKWRGDHPKVWIPRPLRDSGDIRAIAFSPDGKILASLSEDFVIRLWDAEIGTQEQAIGDQDGGEDISAVAFSPDGKMLASLCTTSTGLVQLWDTTKGTRQRKYPMSHDAHWIAFAPTNGRTLVTLGDGKIWLLNIATSTWERFRCQRFVEAIALSPYDNKLASASRYGRIELQDLATGEELQTFWRRPERPPSSLAPSAMAFSQDSKMLVVAYFGGSILVWNIATGTCLQSISNQDDCRYISFSLDGQFLYLNHRTIIDWLEPDDAIVQEPDMLMVTNEWVTRGGKRLLWLPREYRWPHPLAVHDNVIAIGHISGVVFLYFDFEVEA